LPKKQPAVTKSRRLRIGKADKKKEPANLSEADICFIAEAIYQRQLRQWSQEMVAIKAGVRRTAIQLIESWQRGLSLRVAGDIAKAFSSNIGFFIDEGRAKKDLPHFQHFFPVMPK
jgi:DNA-binding XRE family transcriptional regulator